MLALATGAAFASVTIAAPELRFVKPQATDPRIRDVDLPNADGHARQHVVVVDREAEASSSPTLFVFLPGTGGPPTQYLELLGTAAETCGRAIGLVYDSWPSVNGITTGDPDPTLPERIRRERLFGEDLVEQGIDVDKPNSVLHRLEALLEWLADEDPQAGWERFLDERGGVRWDRIVASGHSQGAGHAAYLSKRFPLAGVVMFAGPGDFVQDLGPAPWLFLPSIVAPARMSGLVHVDDPASAGFFFTQSLLGIEGPVEIADGRTADELERGRRASTRELDHANAHSAVAVDEFLPRDERGVPLYREAWRFMIERALPRPTADRR